MILNTQPTFLKTAPTSRDAVMEAEATMAAHNVGSQSGFFRVPRVLSAVDDTLEFEYIPGIVSLRSALAGSEPMAAEGLIRRVGQSLGVAHRDRRPPAGFGFGGVVDPVWVHGDYSLTNVQYHRVDDELVILDWAPPRWQPLPPVASSQWDLALFLVDLHYQRFRDPLLIRCQGDLTRAFLEGYASVRPVAASGFRRTVATTAAANYLGARRPLKRLARLPHLSSLVWHIPRQLPEPTDDAR